MSELPRHARRRRWILIGKMRRCASHTHWHYISSTALSITHLSLGRGEDKAHRNRSVNQKLHHIYILRVCVTSWESHNTHCADITDTWAPFWLSDAVSFSIDLPSHFCWDLLMELHCFLMLVCCVCIDLIWCVVSWRRFD